jgi:ribosomal protein S18 acetylase RimI-like enzyme
MAATIRSATTADAEAVRTMASELAAHQNQLEYMTADVDDWRTTLRRADVHIFIAEQDGEPVGYVSVLRRLHLWTGRDILALDDIYVRPAARDEGVGHALMRAVAGLAVPEQLPITWGARVENEAAHRFYRRLGASMTLKAMFSWRPGEDQGR